MMKYFNKCVLAISCNFLNLSVPLSIQNLLDSGTNNYTYSAYGKKMKDEMKFVNQTKTMDYVGNVVCYNVFLKCILMDCGCV